MAERRSTQAVTVRRATHQDGALLLAWRNDPETRANSVHQEMVRPEEHETWLARKLADPRCLLLVGLDGAGAPVGQVRFDVDRGGGAEASITVAPEQRGQGFGTPLLAAACAEAFRALDVRSIRALIRRDNRASRRIFEQAGFGRWTRAVVDSQEYLQCWLAGDPAGGRAAAR